MKFLRAFHILVGANSPQAQRTTSLSSMTHSLPVILLVGKRTSHGRHRFGRLKGTLGLWSQVLSVFCLGDLVWESRGSQTRC